jgi:hypothetical protein
MRRAAPLALLLMSLAGCASLKGNYDHSSGQWQRSEGEESFWMLVGMAAQCFGPAVNH